MVDTLRTAFSPESVAHTTVDQRQVLLARLAATRARLFASLVGIPAETLSILPIGAHWYAGDLLAHLGEQDHHYAAALRRARDGRPLQHWFEPRIVMDARIGEQSGGWRFEQGLIYAVRGRIAFLRALAPFDDQLYGKTIRATIGGARRQGSPRTWTRMRWMHDQQHLGDLLHWRACLAPQQASGPPALIMAALRAARDDFNTTLTIVAWRRAAGLRLHGGWTLRELQAHLAAWDGRLLSCVRAIHGEAVPLDRERIWEQDADRINAYILRTRRYTSDSAAETDRREAREALLSALSDLAPADWSHPSHMPSFCSYQTVYACATHALDHYLHHTTALRNALHLPLPRWLLSYTPRAA